MTKNKTDKKTEMTGLLDWQSSLFCQVGFVDNH